MEFQESPWEIGINDVGGFDNSVKELPHMIKVTGFSFTQIHTFTPALQDNQYSDITPDKRGVLSNTVSGFGDQRYIALTNGENTNYRMPEYIVEKPPCLFDRTFAADDLSIGDTMINFKKQGIIHPSYSQTDKNKAINDIKLVTQQINLKS
jgi:hypothetical protein